MLTLSPDRINLHAPYRLVLSDSNVLRFITDHGLVYEIGFAEDYTFMEENLYQFFISELTGNHYAPDSKIKSTVWAVLEEFFQQNENVVIYICDTSDGKQAIRNRLFQKWYNDFEDRDEYAFMSGVAEYEGVGYFASAIAAKSNPNIEEVKLAFEDFVCQVQGKLQ